MYSGINQSHARYTHYIYYLRRTEWIVFVTQHLTYYNITISNSLLQYNTQRV